MTERKRNILDTALRLFAEEGFGNTSTSRIAREAGVSEGLIFRHFNTKQGLLHAVLSNGRSRLKILIASILSEENPQKIINKSLRLPLALVEEDNQTNFWKLYYKLKWEIQVIDPQEMKPLEDALAGAFTAFGYNAPRLEAQTLLVLLDGLATQHFLSEDFDLATITDFLLNKYQE